MKTESLCTPASEKSHRVRDQGTHAALTKKWQTLPPSSYMQATKGRGSTVPRGLWSLGRPSVWEQRYPSVLIREERRVLLSAEVPDLSQLDGSQLLSWFFR